MEKEERKKGGLGIASLIIGIVTLVLCWVLGFLITPVSLVGLILGIINVCKKNKSFVGIILNSFSLLLSLIMGVVLIIVGSGVLFAGLFTVNKEEIKEGLNTLYTELDYQNSDNFVAGKYRCKGVDKDNDDYTITLHLNEDYTFLYGPYTGIENNYAKGTYTFEDEKKEANNGYKYFMVTLSGDPDEFVVDGEVQDRAFESKMEFGVTTVDTKRQGVIMFTNTYNMYYCYSK